MDLNLVGHFPEDGSAVSVSTLAEQTKADEEVLSKYVPAFMGEVIDLTSFLQGAVLTLLSGKGIFKQKSSLEWSHSVMSATLLESSFQDLISSM